MAWYDRFIGRNSNRAAHAAGDALVKHKDALRVEVLQEVKGQMNRVFAVVDDLKGQVTVLREQNHSLTGELANVRNALSETNSRINTLQKAVHENAARNAKGFTAVSEQISQMKHGSGGRPGTGLLKTIDAGAVPDLNKLKPAAP